MKTIELVHKFLYTLLGLASLSLFGIAIWTKADPVVNAFYYEMTVQGEKNLNFTDTWSFLVISLVSVALSIAIAFISITAIVAKFETLWVLKCVSWSNLLLLSITITGIILIAGNKDVSDPVKLRKTLTKVLTYKIENYKTSQEDKEFMDTVQTTVGCCGDINVDIYVQQQFVPASCGNPPSGGCIEKSLRYLRTRLRIFGGLYGIILIIQMSTLFVSCMIPSKLQKYKKTGKRTINGSSSVGSRLAQLETK